MMLTVLLVLLFGSIPHGAAGAKQKNRVQLFLNPELQLSNLSYSSSLSTANHSLSPWTYKTTCESNRFPKCIAQAQCLTSGCVHEEGGKEDMGLESKPILCQVLVLRRIRTAGKKTVTSNRVIVQKRKNYRFKLESKVIPIGCTCVKPVVQRQI